MLMHTTCHMSHDNHSWIASTLTFYMSIVPKPTCSISLIE
jgi:hypothetical protein